MAYFTELDKSAQDTIFTERRTSEMRAEVPVMGEKPIKALVGAYEVFHRGRTGHTDYGLPQRLSPGLQMVPQSKNDRL